MNFWLLQVLIVSLCVNAFLFYKLRNHIKERPQSLELKEFLTDIRSGGALLKVTRLDPSDVMIRSPRGRL